MAEREGADGADGRRGGTDGRLVLVVLVCAADPEESRGSRAEESRGDAEVKYCTVLVQVKNSPSASCGRALPEGAVCTTVGACVPELAD